MKKWMLLCSLAAVAGAVVVARSQDPQFNVQALTPYLTEEPPKASTTVSDSEFTATASTLSPAFYSPSEFPAVAPEAEEPETISVVFRNATFDQVSKWLVGRGFNLVIPAETSKSNRKVSLSLKDVPAEEGLDAIATALGGRWTRKGSVRVFQPGRSVGVFGAPMMEGRLLGLKGIDTEGMAISPQHLKEFKILGGEKLSLEQQKEIEQMAKHMAEMGAKLGETMPKTMELHLEKMADAFGKDGKVHLELAEKMAREGKKFEALGKEMELKFGKDFAEKMEKIHTKDGQEIRIMEKSMAEAHAKDAKKHEALAKEMEKKFGKDFAEKMEKSSKVIELRMKQLDKELAAKDREFKIKTDGKGMLFTEGRPVDFKSLAKSLTPEQREKHKKQGFLRFGDLDDAQRKLLGNLSAKGSWTVKYQVDDESLTIKSDSE